MKSEIIQMMAFPRDIIRGSVPFETCGHSGHYASHDSECRICESRIECEWLYHNDELSGLTEKTLDDLLDALQSALFYVDACVARAGHTPAKCHCKACSWLKEAETLHASVTDQISTPNAKGA